MQNIKLQLQFVTHNLAVAGIEIADCDASCQIVKGEQLWKSMEQTTDDMTLFEHSCALLQERITHNLPPIPLSVCMTTMTLGNPFNIYEIVSMIKEYGIHCYFLGINTKLEKEEDSKNTAVLNRNLRFLGERGIRISEELPFTESLQLQGADQIRIGRNLLDGVAESLQKRKKLEHIIKTYVMEGKDILCQEVETEEEYELLREYGCPKVQGNYFSRQVGEREIKTEIARYPVLYLDFKRYEKKQLKIV